MSGTAPAGALAAPGAGAMGGGEPAMVSTCGLDLAGLLIAPLRLFFQGVQHHFVQPHVHLDFLRRRREFAQRQFACEHFVEHHAQRINVRPMIHRLRMFHLLRRHVVRRAHGVLCRRVSVGFGAPSPSILAMPKSAIFTRPSLSSRMFSGLMSRCTMPSLCANCSASHICGTIASACSGVRLPGLLDLAQIQPVHVFHDQVMQFARLRQNHTRTRCSDVQAGQHPGLAVESLGKCRGPPLSAAEFSAPPTGPGRLARLIDRPHAASADALQDFQLRKQPRRTPEFGGGTKDAAAAPPGFRGKAASQQTGGTQPSGASGGTAPRHTADRSAASLGFWQSPVGLERPGAPLVRPAWARSDPAAFSTRLVMNKR